MRETATDLYCPECGGPLECIVVRPTEGVIQESIRMRACPDCQPGTLLRWQSLARRWPAMPDVRVARCAAQGCDGLRDPGGRYCRACAEVMEALAQAREADVTAGYLARWLVGCVLVLGMLCLCAQCVRVREQADRLAAEARQPAGDMLRWEMAQPEGRW